MNPDKSKPLEIITSNPADKAIPDAANFVAGALEKNQEMQLRAEYKLASDAFWKEYDAFKLRFDQKDPIIMRKYPNICFGDAANFELKDKTTQLGEKAEVRRLANIALDSFVNSLSK